MAARSRITVLLLLFLLSTEHSFAVNLNELTSLVKELLNRYPVKNMFSLAVSIPQNQNQNQGANRGIEEVLIKNRADDVKNKIKMKEVYVGYRMAAAKPLWRENDVDHAESRVVDVLDKGPEFQDDLLLFYVSSSPCDRKCTNEENEGNILERIKDIKKWKDHAFVFSKIFQPRHGRPIPETKHRDSLERLGEQIGLENIFRCDRDQNKQMKCVCCSNDGQVAQTCVSDNPEREGRRVKGGKRRRGKGGRGGKGKGSRRGGRSRSQGLDQDWIFVSDF
ncbi:uncharacterized protein LOC128430132 [Pleuronectes platessa]|uniref:uncharacterized protein LOC128430132 n=1 Tax=Pleuronectes platessa TaxID=8262 RepID=UPI00232A69FE|nr:uncharacterized protein LOC128430132 [Pleuronectes platessa]